MSRNAGISGCGVEGVALLISDVYGCSANSGDARLYEAIVFDDDVRKCGCESDLM